MIKAVGNSTENESENLEDKEICQQIKISVIVPVYNVELYIRRCLDSILAQTYKNLEIILVDDGSTDRSGEICDEYAARDAKIQVVHKKNEGLVSARQAGVQRATGEYITNVDSDDWIEPEAYEFVVRRLIAYHPDILVLGYQKEYAGFTEEYRQLLGDGLYLGDHFWSAFNNCVKTAGFFCQPIDMSLCNKVIKAELLRKHQLNCNCVTGKNEDDAVIFPCLMDVDSVYVESCCFYHYCVRKNSLMWERRNEDYELFLKLAKSLIATYVSIERKNNKVDKTFLLYKLYYHLLFDVPEKLITSQKCTFFPEIKAQSNIIVYGKGVFAHRLISRFNELKYCNIVANVDKTDIEQVKRISEGKYDYIVIAILNCAIVNDAMNLIIASGIAVEKILCIEKENLVLGSLPEEVRMMWKMLYEL